MKKRILKLFLILLTLICIWHLPPISYDISKVDKELVNLKEPFKSVKVNHYFDGGSVGIVIIDENNIELELFLDASMDSKYPSYSVITINEKKVQNVDETKKMLEEVLIKYSRPDGLWYVRSKLRSIINFSDSILPFPYGRLTVIFLLLFLLFKTNKLR